MDRLKSPLPPGSASIELDRELCRYQEKLSLGNESPADFFGLAKLCEKAIFELKKKEVEVLEYRAALFDTSS